MVEEKTEDTEVIKGSKIFEVIKFDGNSFDIFVRATEESETGWTREELSVISQTLKLNGLNVSKLAYNLPTKTTR